MSAKSEKDNKGFNSYLNSIIDKTGKTIDDLKEIGRKQAFKKHGEAVAWFKKAYELGHGHANLIAKLTMSPDGQKPTTDQAASDLFSKTKSVWRKSYDDLAKKVSAFGKDVEISIGKTYVNFHRGTKRFAIVKPSSGKTLDIGIKNSSTKTKGRLKPSGTWNSMVDYRISIKDPTEIDGEIVEWLKEAYNKAK